MALACGTGSAEHQSPTPVARAAEVAEAEPAQPMEAAEPAGEPDSEGPRVLLITGDGDTVPVRVEVAHTPAQLERGLMYRRELGADAGMLFVYDEMGHRSFWMENTYLPLDLIFIDDAHRVVGIVENAEPLTRDAREVEGESQFVLEVNAGFARRHGLGPGNRVRFEGVPQIPSMESPSNPIPNEERDGTP